ncbi:hypothetical protein C9374_009433 [Naegleria lovaniensis]|uniref:Uncharacterized protein n=1 Tax=Naegleria lovaniensis TaxID=51637 RepID=A0AA88KQX8_NAELO|nr:uncharacterized protein C9374_009433 [Naegleria lovaniensis]KAG2392856.1 hypothetical protein C9374_009433 [Naegleria lovaniensis]
MASGALLRLETDPSCSLCFNINQIVVVPLIDFANTWRIRAIFPTNNEVIDRFEISFRKLSKNKTEKRPTCIVEYPPKPQPQFNLFAVNRIKIVDHKVNHHEFIVENETFSFTTYELTLEPSMDMMQTSFPAKKRKIFDVSLKTNKDNRFVQKLVAEFYIGLDGFNVVTLQNKFRGFEEALSYCFIPTYDPLKRIALYSKFLEKKYSPECEYMSQEVTPMKGFKWIEEAGSNPNLESMIEILSEDPFFILYTLGFDSSYTDEEKQVTLDYLSTIDRIHHIAEYGRSWMLAFTLVQSLPLYPKLLLARKKTGYEAIFSAASRILSTDLFNQGVTKDEFIKASVLFYFKTKSLEIIPWD